MQQTEPGTPGIPTSERKSSFPIANPIPVYCLLSTVYCLQIPVALVAPEPWATSSTV